MGIVRNGLLGTVVNKVGPVIGKKVRGQNVLVSLSHTSSAPDSPEQEEQQYRFALLSRFLGAHSELIDLGFKRKARQQSPMTTAFKYNYPNAFLDFENVDVEGALALEDKIKLDYSGLRYSLGPIYGPNCGTAVRNPDASCTFSWLSYPQSRDNQHTDRAGYVIWNASIGEAVYNLDVASRASLAFNVAIPPDYLGSDLHFYMHFFNPDTEVRGNSIYLGSTI